MLSWAFQISFKLCREGDLVSWGTNYVKWLNYLFPYTASRFHLLIKFQWSLCAFIRLFSTFINRLKLCLGDLIYFGEHRYLTCDKLFIKGPLTKEKNVWKENTVHKRWPIKKVTFLYNSNERVLNKKINIRKRNLKLLQMLFCGKFYVDFYNINFHNFTLIWMSMM